MSFDYFDTNCSSLVVLLKPKCNSVFIIQNAYVNNHTKKKSTKRLTKHHKLIRKKTEFMLTAVIGKTQFVHIHNCSAGHVRYRNTIQANVLEQHL